MGKKISELHSKKWLVVCPNGKEKIIINLKLFCEKNNLSCNGLHRVSKKIQNNYKNFKCKKLEE